MPVPCPPLSSAREARKEEEEARVAARRLAEARTRALEAEHGRKGGKYGHRLDMDPRAKVKAVRQEVLAAMAEGDAVKLEVRGSGGTDLTGSPSPTYPCSPSLMAG